MLLFALCPFALLVLEMKKRQRVSEERAMRMSKKQVLGDENPKEIVSTSELALNVVKEEEGQREDCKVQKELEE